MSQEMTGFMNVLCMCACVHVCLYVCRPAGRSVGRSAFRSVCDYAHASTHVYGDAHVYAFAIVGTHVDAYVPASADACMTVTQSTKLSEWLSVCQVACLSV